MKLVIEDEDIAEVKYVAHYCFGIILTDQEVREILDKNRSYAGECYKWGIDDTESRTSLGTILRQNGKLDTV